jgi:hypothetical protein
MIGFAAGVFVMVLACYKFPMTAPAREAAVKAGKAEYYLNANNEREWRWKP